jgi:hypothetical protein
MAINYPPVFINEYLSDKIPPSLPNRFSSSLNFFPTLPTDLEQLTETFPDAANDVFAVYDRMFKLRRTPFPYIKCEQLLYYFYKTSGDPVALIETSQRVQDLLDRGDDSAKDLNSWIADLWISQGRKGKDLPETDIVTGRQVERDFVTFSGTDFYLPYFHEIRIFQLEETRDIVDFGTARTYAGNKIIIDYDWHESGSREITS